MLSVELPEGTIEYEDTGGDLPVLVFLHGLMMQGTLWRHVVDQLRGEYRCILPTLPLGGHQIPMKPDADLSIVGVAKLVGVFLDKLDLADVTLIQNDWGGAQLLIAAGDTSRIARLVLVSCEAFDNYPPLPARLVVAAARLPGGLRTVMAMLNTRLGRRGPGAWGWLSKRPIPTEVIDEWFRPATEQTEIRRDLKKFVTSVPPKRDLRTIAEASAQFTKPVLIVWATEDKMMPLKHAYRLAEVFPDSRVVEIADSYTLVPEDQPDKLTAAIGAFLAGRPVAQ